MKTNHHYSSLLYKYKKFKLRLDRVMKNGSFARYTYRKRCMLLKRLDRLRRQLEQLSSKWKLAGTGAMALGAMAFAAPEAEAQGLFSSDTFVVNSHTLHDQKNPAIAMDADGDFVVVWQSKYQDDDDYGVYAQRYTSDGNREGEEFKVNTYTTSNQMNPAVAMNADGDFVVVWESYGQDADGYGVYARLYTSDGSAEEEEFIINAWTKGHQ
ncbi:MAG: hypothetical protein GY816_00025, partial [Cytophagales bacterium]|nr:hypothetical protein [Cytophagales bacterium]